MAWVKLHDDILGDPKLMRAARVGGQELVLLPWLLAFASKAADHGRLSVGATAAEPEDIAYQTPGVTAAQVEACMRALVAIGVLNADDDGCLRFAKWEDRQAKPSDSKSAVRERVKRHRAKKHPVTRDSNAKGALQGVTSAQDAPESVDVTPCNATEKRRGEEKRREAEKRKRPAADASGGASAPDSAPLVAPAVVVLPAQKGAASWPAVGAAWWVPEVGTISVGRFGKALKPIVDLYEWEPVFADLQRWVAEKKAAGMLPKLEWYAEVASMRLNGTRPPMYDPERMELTAYGERMSRPDKVPA